MARPFFKRLDRARRNGCRWACPRWSCPKSSLSDSPFPRARRSAERRASRSVFMKAVSWPRPLQGGKGLRSWCQVNGGRERDWNRFRRPRLDLLRSAVGGRRQGRRRRLALRAREPGHVFTEERGERCHQLLRHLGRERVPAKLAGRAIRADEGDAGRTSAQVIFERLCPLRR